MRPRPPTPSERRRGPPSRALGAILALGLAAVGCDAARTDAPPTSRLPVASARAGARPLVLHWVGDEASDAPLVVLLHGWGAPGDDLVPLGRRLRERLGGRVRVLVPEAPLERPGSGRAWWPIELGDRRPIDRGDTTPRGLAEARRDLVALLDGLAERGRLRPGATILAGFSQGAMLAADVALSWDREVAGLAMLSGGPVDEARWERLMRARPPRRVLLGHGTADAMLSYDAAQRLRGRFEGAGSAVEFVSHPGGHGIPEPVFVAFARFVEDAAR